MSSSVKSSFDDQYQALQSGRAIVELADWSSISVTGADRQAFLHNFCTNDVKRLVPGTNCEAFCTSVKGKIVGHGWILCRDDELVFFGPPGQGSRLVEHLDRYVIREDVKLCDMTGARSYMLVAGGVPTEACRQPIPLSIIARDDTNICELQVHEMESAVRALVDSGFVAAAPEVFLAARIEAGFPLFGADFDDRNLPQEVGRDKQAISFTKGCYLGQETVARIDALGHVNQKIVGVRFFGSAVPDAGTEMVLHNAKVGEVKSATFSPKLEAPLALGMVRRDANAVGTKLQSSFGECEVIELPIVFEPRA
ncbi:MAG TPA: glycine cleavage T C-terminal barrel domain-containing protein [Lacipirellulaceae bacterium]|nr:glycine cleavage T C-terminal barrel domain-containing protein [Lacipirellulaceae bacterium]